MQDTKTVSDLGCCRIISIGEFGSRKSGKTGKQQRGIQEADARFASLDEKSQRMILSHMIGYIGASKDLISSGRTARKNEVSKIFEVMENMIKGARNADCY